MSKLPSINFKLPPAEFSRRLAATSTRPSTYKPSAKQEALSLNQNKRPMTQDTRFKASTRTMAPKHPANKRPLSEQVRTRSQHMLTNNLGIEISPDVVTFKDIQVNTIYETFIVVRNLQKTSRRIRIVQPQLLNKFRCDYDMVGAVPAGLTMNLLVQFETNILGDFHDELKIMTDDDKTYCIPLHAYESRSDIHFDDFLNLGFVQKGKEVTQDLTFRNKGKKTGKVELKVLNSLNKCLSISPSSVTLRAGECQVVKVSYKSYEPGIFRCIIQVQVDKHIYSRRVDVNATNVDYSRVLIDQSGGEVKQLEFGQMYYGESREIKTTLVNNSPHPIEFKVRFKNGQIHLQEFDQLMTPNETGQEQEQKIISCYPAQGQVGAYNQTDIQFVCKSKVTQEVVGWTNNYALAIRKEQAELKSDEYTYTALFEFNQPNDKEKDLLLYLLGRAVCPTIKLDKFVFEFGECPSKQNRDIILLVSNDNSDSPVDLSFQSTPFYHFSPARLTLQHSQQASVLVSFRPKNLGNFSTTLNLFLNKVYSIPLRMIGICTHSHQLSANEHASAGHLVKRVQSSHTRGGLECLPDHFQKDKHFVYTLHTDADTRAVATAKSRFKKIEDIDNLEALGEQRDQYLVSQFNKKKYNNYIVDSRKERVRQRNQSAIDRKIQQLSCRKEDTAVVQHESSDQKTENAPEEMKKAPPTRRNKKYKALDEEHMGEAPEEDEVQKELREVQLIKAPKIAVRQEKDQLFVTKAIQNYEPAQEKQLLDFRPKCTQPVRKEFAEEVKSHTEEKDIKKELEGKELQRILAGPKVVDFENVFVKSSTSRTFWVRNDLRQSIQVRIETGQEELKGSQQKRQVVPMGQQAGFTLWFKSNRFQNFKGLVKYIINEKHHFHFQVKALVEPVLLEPSSHQMKFVFQDGNNDMTVSNTLLIRNNGNSPGRFCFGLTEQQIFTVYPREGVVQAKSSLECIINYKPVGQTSINTGRESQQNNSKESAALPYAQNKDIRLEEEKLVMRVDDGIEQVIRCQGQTNEAKCQLREKTVSLGQIPICEKASGIIWIKNKDKYSAVYQISQESLPPFTEIYPLKGKMNPDQMIGLKVLFMCKEEVRINQEIVINLRGGQPLRVDFSVQTILPKVSIQENEFDFGEVTTLGNSSLLYMTIVNQSNIESMLALDLRPKEGEEKEGLECLEIKPVNAKYLKSNPTEQLEENKDDNKNDESSVMYSIDYEKELALLNNNQQLLLEEEDPQVNNIVIMRKDQFNDEELSSENNSEEEGQQEKEEKVSSRTYKIRIRPNSKQVFAIKFTPQEVKQYYLELPLTLFGYGELDSLRRVIKCEGLRHRFLLEPRVLDFKKKIIRQLDKSMPSYIEMTLQNPDTKSLHWRIDTTELEQDNVFQILPNEGRIDGGQSTVVKACFNPGAAGVYEKTVQVYLDKQNSKPLMDVFLKGQGSHPRILFDRKEVILPVVPLNVQSRCLFRVINYGYENLTLQHNIIQEFGNVGLELDFPEGRNLGITKNKLKVEAKFQFKKPISFSIPVEFYDDNNRTYQIIISGTTDNCVLTNFQFIQRMGPSNDFSFQFDEHQQIQYQEHDVNSLDYDNAEMASHQKQADPRNKTVASVVSSSNNHLTLLGYQPVHQSLLESSADHLLRWLNHYALLNGIQSFPNDFIATSGAQLFELISFLTGKSNFPYKAKLDNSLKKGEKVKAILAQYESLILDLKEKNALLNTIRPCYLLSYQDYNSYKKMYLNNSQYHFINEKSFTYLSYDNWLTLIYQILKIFYLNRISARSLKSIPNYPEVLSLPDYYLDNSNIMGIPEGVLLRWLEANQEIYERNLPDNPAKRKDSKETHTKITTTQGSHKEAPPKPRERKILNLDKDLKDCVVYAQCVLNYVGPSVAKLVKSMRRPCIHEEDYKQNAEKMLVILQEIGLQTHLQANDLVNPNIREQMLFIAQLFYGLPHYQPKGEPIVFATCLMEEVQKQIELINNTNRTIHYWVKYDGSPDFIKESDSVTIQPKSVYKFKVRFTARLSKEVTGILTFTNKKESNAQAAALVFQLVSQITERKSIQTHQVKSKMYQPTDLKLSVKNIFAHSSTDLATFEVTLINQRNFEFDAVYNEKVRKQKEIEEMKEKANKYSIQKKKTKPVEIERMEEDNALPPAFFCVKDSVRIRKGQSVDLVIQYMPFQLTTHNCKVVFTDPNVGEFQYTIIGEAMLPDPTAEIKLPFQLNVDTLQTYDYLMAFKNDLLQNALRIHENRIRQTQRTKEREELLKMKQNARPEDTLEFEVQIQPPCNQIQFPFSLSLIDFPRQHKSDKNEDKEKDRKKTAKTQKSTEPDEGHTADYQTLMVQAQNASKMNLQFHFKSAFKDATYYLVLSNQTKTDIRVLKVPVTVYPKVMRATLEMKVPVGDEVKQEIPVSNNSDTKDWVIKVQWIGEQYLANHQYSSQQSTNRQELYFSGPKDLTVKKKSTANYVISFRPQTTCEQKCKLILSNPLNNDQFEYDLVGIGEEPLALDHLVVNCVARQSVAQHILLTNPYKDRILTYDLETDLSCLECDNMTVVLQPGRSLDFSFQVRPKLGGVYGGSLTFYERDSMREKFVWYTIVVNAERPRNEQQVELMTQVRKPIIFEIMIKNPLQESAHFEVSIQGEFLNGNSQFSLEPEQQLVYELMFSPLREMKGQGTVAFLNERLGELWYQLQLVSEKASIVRLQQVKAEIGKQKIQQLVLENPSDKEALVMGQCSNPANFSLQPAQIQIPPYSEELVNVVYSPSEIEKLQTADILFKSEQVGNWNFHAQGMGVLPSEYDTKVIHGQLNDLLSDHLLFKNPFKESITVQLSMVIPDEQPPDVFQLLLKKKSLSLSGQQSVSLPFSFHPKQIASYSMVMVVSLNEKLSWRYPIQGVTESAMSTTVFNLVTRAREQYEQDIQITLPGLPQRSALPLSALKFRAMIGNVPEELENTVSRDLQIISVKKQLSSREDFLMYKLKYSPMKPLRVNNLELVVDCEQGGRWKFRVNLECLEPEPDDHIFIESPLNRTTSVCFKLSNKIKFFSSFSAYFTKESDPEFTVTPKSGELEPIGREPKNFVVSFMPQEYGKNSQAKLIIETEFLYWSFAIKGSFPQYKPPEKLSHKVDNRLGKATDELWKEKKQVKKVNHVQNNLKKSPRKRV